MIKVKVVKEKEFYESISINGHALYDDFGKDIVCSAVSSIITTTINSILALEPVGITYSAKSGKVIINNISSDEKVIKLLDVMIKELSELEKSYSDNIKIDKEEK